MLQTINANDKQALQIVIMTKALTEYLAKAALSNDLQKLEIFRLRSVTSTFQFTSRVSCVQ